ncbi:MAG TPA: hypothetical protein VNU00_00405, partial [Candidatus Binataceae bacterium]|nr:hypothetical protein [Candidatus Binataceae bacterium]
MADPIATARGVYGALQPLKHQRGANGKESPCRDSDIAARVIRDTVIGDFSRAHLHPRAIFLDRE